MPLLAKENLFIYLFIQHILLDSYDLILSLQLEMNYMSNLIMNCELQNSFKNWKSYSLQKTAKQPFLLSKPLLNISRLLMLTRDTVPQWLANFLPERMGKLSAAFKGVPFLYAAVDVSA